LGGLLGGLRRSELVVAWKRRTRVERIIRFGAVIAVVLVVFATSPPRASACSCAFPSKLIEDVIRPHIVAVFVGEAISVVDIGYPPETSDGEGEVIDYSPMRWTFQVETVLAGSLPEIVVVGSGRGEGDCGANFAELGRVGLVVRNDGAGLSTNTCGGVWDADELIREHGPGTDPIPLGMSATSGEQNESPPWVWVIAGGSVALAVGGLLVIVRRPSQ